MAVMAKRNRLQLQDEYCGSFGRINVLEKGKRELTNALRLDWANFAHKERCWVSEKSRLEVELNKSRELLSEKGRALDEKNSNLLFADEEFSRLWSENDRHLGVNKNLTFENDNIRLENIFLQSERDSAREEKDVLLDGLSDLALQYVTSTKYVTQLAAL